VTGRPSLARLIDLAVQLEADAERDPTELRRRDREIGRAIDAAGERGDRVLAWLERMREGEGPGARAQRAQGAVAVGLVGAGLLLGASAAAALFTYSGSHPVNVVRVLALFVGVQLLLLAGTALLSLPTAWRRRVPGLAALQDALALLSPGRWAGALRRLLPPAQRAGLERAAGLARAHRRLYGDVQRWLRSTRARC